MPWQNVASPVAAAENLLECPVALTLEGASRAQETGEAP
jgi:hypothetical protein